MLAGAEHSHNPNGLHAQPHLIGSPQDFPTVIWPVTQSLQHLDKAADVDRTTDLSLARALKAAQSCSARVRRLMQDRETYKNIKPESTTHAVGLTPGYILEQCVTELQIHFQCGYSRAIYPCYIGDSSSRLLQPYGTATSALALPIVFAPSEESGDGSATGTVDGRGSNWPEDFDPLLQGHFLQTQLEHDKIPFPVLFVALVEEIYELLASAILHRRAMGVNTPCLAFAHDPLSCQLRAVWAWCVSPEDDSCPEVHVAHAPWSTPPSHSLGVFDVQDQDSASALAEYLYTIKRQLCGDALTAQENAPITRVSLWSSPTAYWRVDQNAFFHDHPDQTGLVEVVNHWLGGVQAWSETSRTPPQEEEDVSINSPVEPEPADEPEPAVEDEDEDEEEEDDDEEEDEDENKLAEAKSALAKAKYDIKRWMKAHPEIVFAEPSHWTTPETAQCGAPSLSPEMALVYGLRATKCAFPSEFLYDEKTPEPLKITLEYIRSSLPPSPDLASIDLSEVNVPTLPVEIMMDEEPSIGPPCTLERVEDIEAFLNFCAAAQIENWIRLTLKLEGMAPLAPAMVTYLMDNIPTFLKVSEMCAQANTILSGNAALYGECFDLLLGAHGSVCKVYKRLELRISTARQRLFDEQNTLADEISPGGCVWWPDSYPSANKFDEFLWSPGSDILRDDDLKNSLEISAVACFDGMRKAFTAARHAAMYDARQQRADTIEFSDYWHITVLDMEGFSPAALQVVNFESLACDAVLCTLLPVDISVDDLKTISLFQDGVPRDTTSVSSPSSAEVQLPKMLRESLDLAIGKVLPPPIARSEVPRQLGILDSNLRMHEQRQHLDTPLALSLPLVLLEHKNGGLDPRKGAAQTCLHLTMACRFMASLGIHDFPIFGLSTSRSRVRLFCAWAESPTTRMSMIFIADQNCPEWDISKPSDALRLSLFLQHVRTTHRDRLEQKFDEVKKELSESWKHKDSWTPQERTLREWKIGHQKDSAEYKEWLVKAAEAWPEFYSLQAQVDQAQSAVDRAKEEFGDDSDSDVDFI